MLEVKELSKTIDGRTIIEKISFTLQPGDIAGLVGRNGAGKTTLLRCMIGILLPDSGDVLMSGRSIFAEPAAKTGIIYVPDGRLPYQNYTAGQLARLYRLIYPNFDDHYFYTWMDRLSLPSRQQIRTFSKGMNTLFSLILAFAARTHVVLLDEPIDGLDPIAKRQCLELIVDEVASREAAVLISSHRLQELESICDRVYMLAESRIQSTTDLNSIQQQYSKFQLAYGETEALAGLRELPGVHVLSQTGRIITVLVEGDPEQAAARLESTNPLLIDRLPLQLEDLFVVKLGGEARVG